MKTLSRILLLNLLPLLAMAASPPGYELGDAVGEFKLKNVDGTFVALSDYADKNGLVVIFDCNTCPYSKAYNQRIIDLNAAYGPKGFPVVTINANDPNMSPGDSFDEMVSRAKAKKYTFPYLVDETQEVARAFGATNTPHVFVLQREGKNFKVAYMGAIDNNSRDASAADKKYVEDAINALLGNKEVPVDRTKAIGCTIKYRSA
jgi:peroxiredoxin